MMDVFTRRMRVPYALALLAIVAEVFGGLALPVGLLTRSAALGIAAVTVLSAWTRSHKGWFKTWADDKDGEHQVLQALVVSIAAALVFAGASPWSLDAWLSGLLV